MLRPALTVCSRCQVYRTFYTARLPDNKQDDILSEQTLQGSNLQRLLATSSDCRHILGPRRVRSTVIEAAVRKIADHLLIFDSIDRELLNHELNAELDTNSDSVEPKEYANLLVNVDRKLLNTLDKATLDKVHGHFLQDFDSTAPRKHLKEYIEESSYLPSQYRFSNSQAATDRLSHYLRTSKPELLKGLSKKLRSLESLPNLNSFHEIIIQLKNHRYSKPAQLVLDTLYATELQLSPKTLAIALDLAIANSDIDRFSVLARAMDLSEPPVNKSLSKYVKGEYYNGKSVDDYWFERNEIDEKIYRRFVPTEEAASSTSTNVGTSASDIEIMNIYIQLLDGFLKFGWYERVDLVLNQYLEKSLEYNSGFFTILFRIAKDTADDVRLLWTWKEVRKALVKQSECEVHKALQVDKDVLTMAIITARSLGNMQLLNEIEQVCNDSSIKVKSHYQRKNMQVLDTRQKNVTAVLFGALKWTKK
jgi:hypothetical protein